MIILAMKRNSYMDSGDSNMLVSKYVLNLIYRKGNTSQSFAIGSFAWFFFRALQTVRPFGSMTVHVCVRVNMDVISKVRGAREQPRSASIVALFFFSGWTNLLSS